MAHSVAETGGRTKHRPTVRPILLRVLLAIYLLTVLRITQWPTLADPSALARLERALTWWHAHGLPTVVDLAVLEAAANVAMFAPMGFLVPLVARWRRGRAWLAVPVGAAFSTAIELSQLAFFPERVATVTDVVMNAAGTALGVGLAPSTRLGRVSTPDHGRAGHEQAATSTGLGRLLEPSELAPVDLDLRRVFWGGIALWTVALLVAVVLTATGRTGTRPVWIGLTGVGLGLIALLWERRRRARGTASGS